MIPEPPKMKRGARAVLVLTRLITADMIEVLDGCFGAWCRRGKEVKERR